MNDPTAQPPRVAAQPMITVTTRLALDVKTAVDQHKQDTGETLVDLFDRLLRAELGLAERRR